MELYLVQHGDAKSEEQDPDRPLSARGKEEAGRVAMRLAESGVKPDRIFHSPKLRAKQTADIFAGHMHLRSSEMEGMKPMDDPKSAASFIGSQEKNVMLVGHLPHLSRLASLLLNGKSEPELVKFRMAACICLVKEENWKVKWMLPPELA